MTTEIKKMSVAEFRKLGYLKELNRQFLHPLGLALEVVVYPNGAEVFGEVWDYRDDPEGLHFRDPYTDEELENALRIDDELGAKIEVRCKMFQGDYIQPLGWGIHNE